MSSIIILISFMVIFFLKRLRMTENSDISALAISFILVLSYYGVGNGYNINLTIFSWAVVIIGIRLVDSFEKINEN